MKKSKPNLAYQRIFVDLGEIMPVISEQLDRGLAVRLPVKGTSMLPLLREGRDSVIIEKPKRDLLRGDVVLYRRKNGDYVLHRIVAITGGGYTMCGDNQHRVERGIGREDIIAVMTSYMRGESEKRISSLPYKIYLAWRVFLRRAKNLLFRIKRRFFTKRSGCDEADGSK